MSGCKTTCAHLAPCNCCDGIQTATPQSTVNRPGLSALNYRVGTHAIFLETMRARLSGHSLTKTNYDDEVRRPLAALTTRSDGDPSLALLDACAAMSDVLSFYQERIANEGYLRTATEQHSVHELARLVGYRPRPGVAASTYLAYTLDQPGDNEVVIPAGARVQSLPGPGEQPQSFETSEELKARAGWNRLVPRQTVPPQRNSTVDANGRTIYLKGTSNNLKQNEPLLIIDSIAGKKYPKLFRIKEINLNAKKSCTALVLEPWEGQEHLLEKVDDGIERVMQAVSANAPSGITAGRVKSTLATLQNPAIADPDRYSLRKHVTDVIIPILQKEHDAAPANAHRLRTWLQACLQQINSMLLEVNIPEPTSTAVNRNLVSNLTKSASRPLANSLQLSRKLNRSLGSNSDAALNLLQWTSPQLKETLATAVANYEAQSEQFPPYKVFAFRVKAGLFGKNAPDPKEETPGLFVVRSHIPNEPHDKEKASHTIYLDRNYDSILPDTWLVLDFAAAYGVDTPAVMNGQAEATITEQSYLLTKVSKVAYNIARADYGISGESVKIGLTTQDVPSSLTGGINAHEMMKAVLLEQADLNLLRDISVYAQSEELELAETPLETPVCDGAKDALLELDGLYPGLEPGRFVVVTGERTDVANTHGVQGTEVVMISEVIHDLRDSLKAVPASFHASANGVSLPGDHIHTFVRFDQSLNYCYRRDSIVIYGNVVKATHGETRHEILGSGDAATARQAFALKQTPVTYLSAPTAVGAESTLQLFINDLRWQETKSFIDQGSKDRAFMTQVDNDGKVKIVTGDGQKGARPPTGSENITAVYRTGLGVNGNVGAGQLKLLATKPLGVKEVINPVRASGGADADGRDQIRRNAPLAVMALDRIVSIRDYADFARNFAGIGKADAIELGDGQRNVVHVTIAGIDDAAIDADSDLYCNLRRALTSQGDPFQPVQLAVRELLLLVASAGVRISPDYRWERVAKDVRSKLQEKFGFARRELAQDITSSEFISAIQSVRGVVYVDLDVFGALPSMKTDDGPNNGWRPLTPNEITEAVADIVQGGSVAPRVKVEPARLCEGALYPAQLAVLVPQLPDTLILNQIRD